jgi:type IV secretory pathway protease TraF
MVLALAVFQFSENTADPDLWAHAMFGEQILLTGKLQRVEPYSWTAPGSRWINHEWLAEAMIGAAHLAGGGGGILLLKILVGLATFALALAIGLQDLRWPERAVAWAIGGIAVVEISYGFAARPQIFTALFLAAEFWLLRGIARGGIRWGMAVPVLFVLWMNTHGGVLAGGAMLFISAVALLAQWFIHRSGSSADNPSTTFAERLRLEPVSGTIVLTVWLCGAASAAALLINPYGMELLRWIISEVMDLSARPELQEWGATRIGWNHATYFILVLIAAVSWIFTRRRRALWEICVCASLAFFALRSVRHTPLFAISVLAFAPPHAADALDRLRGYLEQSAVLFKRAAVQRALAAGCAVLSTGIIAAAFTLHKEHPLTMEVPKNQYPVSAVGFIREHRLSGKLLVFFDWGEMCLWELPQCTVSVDGRWDTCYPRALILEHWKFYNDQPVDKNVLDVSRADIALLPSNLAGAMALSQRSAWKAVYFDDLAVVLVRDLKAFPQLNASALPMRGAQDAAAGRVPFPGALAVRVSVCQ